MAKGERKVESGVAIGERRAGSEGLGRSEIIEVKC